MSTPSKDLFDDTTMSFGDHLEALRTHLFKAVVGLVLCVIFSLVFGQQIIDIMREPIDRALDAYSLRRGEKVLATNDLGARDERSLWQKLQEGWDKFWNDPAPLDPVEQLQTIEVRVPAAEVTSQLHELDPGYPEVTATDTDGQLTLHLTSPVFAQLQRNQAVALNIQEPFMTYLKVCMIAGMVISSPWIFWQVWQFVAAGLYRHERKYVYWYGVLSLVLFLTGFVFCFKVVMPFVIGWLLEFFGFMSVEPQIRLSEWISFAVMLPLMFGISFQLPLVMRFLQVIGIVSTQTFRDRRRMAVLVIAFLSMVLTPAEPMSMILMMLPLILLYEVGILLCHYAPSSNPFEAEPV